MTQSSNTDSCKEDVSETELAKEGIEVHTCERILAAVGPYTSSYDAGFPVAIEHGTATDLVDEHDRVAEGPTPPHTRYVLSRGTYDYQVLDGRRVLVYTSASTLSWPINTPTFVNHAWRLSETAIYIEATNADAIAQYNEVRAKVGNCAPPKTLGKG